MSYKPSLATFFNKRNGKLLEGKDSVLLAENKGKFYRVQEHIGLLTKIIPQYTSGVPEVKIRFAGGKEYSVRAYLDSNIQENCLVSIYGIFTSTSNGELEFTCKGGMVRLFNSLSDAGRINTKYIYRFGGGELTRPIESTRYSVTLEGIEELEKNMLWIYSAENIEEIEEKSKETFEEEDCIVDFTKTQQFFVNEDNTAIKYEI